MIQTWPESRMQWVDVVFPDSKVHGAKMGPTWALSSPDGPHVGLMDLVIRVVLNSTPHLLQPVISGNQWPRWLLTSGMPVISLSVGQSIITELCTTSLGQWWVEIDHTSWLPQKSYYCKISNVRFAKFQNLNVSHLVLQLSLPNPLKPSVK